MNEITLNRLRSLSNDTVKTAFRYFDSLGLSASNLIDELKDDFSEEKIISVNSKNDSEAKQIIINSLEDRNNECRVVFAVDKLNEGWDVLNLFDIIRLYDTRDAKAGSPGKTTIQEAQLVGRGARYCPFKIDENTEPDRRKYDSDIDNEMRICETLHYHCSHNPKYISELLQALKEIGIVPDEKVEVSLELKEDFKASKFYKSGFILLNRKAENDPNIFLEYQEPKIRHHFIYSIRTAESKEGVLFDNNYIEESRPAYTSTQSHEIALWDKLIIKKALSKIPFYYFNNISRVFPSIKSINDFITLDKYLGSIKVDVSGLAKDIKVLSPKVKMGICLKIFSEISEEIYTKFGDFRGTKTFHREPIRKLFRNKKLTFSINSKDSKAEIGLPTMRHNIPQELYVNLLEKDWYAFTENYGTAEEKFLVKFLDNQMEDLKAKFKDIYLLRNEGFFKLYRFSDAKAIEPDFVLFMIEKKSGEDLIYQLFIEPKGEHLLAVDAWKEEFLAEI